MIRPIVIITISFLLFLTSEAFSASLEESFKGALLNNQIESIGESRLKQYSEIKKNSEGAYLPNISLRSNYLKQNKFNDQKAIGFNLTSNLYNGNRDQKIIENADIQLKIGKNEIQIDRIKLYTQVIESYYSYLVNLADVKNLELLKKQSEERASEIKKRLQIGRSRRGELLQAEAQISNVEAQLANGLGLVKQEEGRFVLITGLAPPILDLQNEKMETMESLEYYLSISNNRDDLKKKELEIEQLQQNIQKEKNHFLPKLDLQGNWYVLKEGGSSTSRSSLWDVGLTLTLPLYEGGSSAARVRESVEKKQISTYELIDFEKTIKIEITSRYEIYRRYFSQIKMYTEALDKAKKSYEETIKDYRLGLVTNLDVLASLNTYLDIKRNLDRTRMLVQLNKKMLESSAGIIPNV